MQELKNKMIEAIGNIQKNTRKNVSRDISSYLESAMDSVKRLTDENINSADSLLSYVFYLEEKNLGKKAKPFMDELVNLNDELQKIRRNQLEVENVKELQEKEEKKKIRAEKNQTARGEFLTYLRDNLKGAEYHCLKYLEALVKNPLSQTKGAFHQREAVRYGVFELAISWVEKGCTEGEVLNFAMGEVLSFSHRGGPSSSEVSIETAKVSIWTQIILDRTGGQFGRPQIFTH